MLPPVCRGSREGNSRDREKYFSGGELLQTSFGTGMGANLDFYREIPLTSMPYGQAMAVLCLTEYLRKYF